MYTVSLAHTIGGIIFGDKSAAPLWLRRFVALTFPISYPILFVLFFVVGFLAIGEMILRGAWSIITSLWEK